MKLIIKILLGLFIFFIVLIVGLGIFVKVKYPPERIKSIVLDGVSKKINREIRITDLSVGIIKGIRLKGIEVSEFGGFDNGTFVRSDEIGVSFQLLPLLMKKIVINKFLLISPQINIIRLTANEFNFTDLLKPIGAERKQIEFIVSHISISKGGIYFTDKTEEKLSTDIKDIELDIKGFSQTKPFFAEFSCDLMHKNAKYPVSFTGSINIKDENIKIKKLTTEIYNNLLNITGETKGFKEPELNLFIKGEKIDIDGFSKKFNLPKGLQIKGKPEFEISAAGNLDRLKISGDINLNKSEVVFEDLFKKPVNIPLNSKIDLLVENKNSVVINRVDFTIKDTIVNVSGVFDLAEKKKNALKLSSSKIILKELSEIVPVLKGYNMDGTVDIDLNLNGDLSEPDLSGIAKISGLNGKIKNSVLSNVNCKINLKGKTITIDELSGEVDGEKFALSGRLVNFKKPNIALNLKISKLDLNRYIGETKEESSKGLDTKEKKVLDDIIFNGKVEIGQLIYDRYQLTNFLAEINLVKSVLTVKPVSFQLYGGSFNGALQFGLGNLEISKIKSSFDVTLKNLILEEAIKDSPIKPNGKFLAVVSGITNISIVGSDSGSTNGGGSLELTNVKMSELKLLDKIVNALEFGSGKKMQELKELNFEKVIGKFTITDGKIKIDDFHSLNGDKLDIYGSGSYGLVDKVYDIKGNIKLVKGFIGGDLLKYEGDGEGRLAIPYKITGTLDEPKATVDWSKLITKKLQEDVNKKVEEIKEDIKKKVEDEGKKLFKQIFGK